MLDIKFIRENPDKVKLAAKQKNIKVDIDGLIKIDDERRIIISKIEELRTSRNEIANLAKSGKPTPEAIEEGKRLKEEIAKLEAELQKIEDAYMDLMVKVPTIPSPDTPVGSSEDQNVESEKWGEIRKFDFTPKNHIELAEALDIIDFDRGVKTAGFRGYYLKNEGTLLVMAMMNYAINKMAQKGYAPFIPPTLIKGDFLFGSGYFKGREYDSEEDNIYEIATSDQEVDGSKAKEKKFLIGTAEPSLLAYYAGETLKEEDLPIKMSGYSPCYRSEIGSYGKDTKGLYRVHEFMKIEQVVIMKADIEESNRIQDEMLGISKELHRDLGLPYRILSICTGDMSAGKYRAFDIEAWMPGMGRYGETGSASNFLDWQARRLNVKYIDKNGNRKFVYMLNDTALPSVRPLIAILENYQQADGSVIVPEVLRPYMGGISVIRTKK
ncbi:MAG: serine--tRNA ligase [Candidatus Gracilibacteria bacterium]|nr:serine--tRNA ligase [Candidatus Gracilibacteria bacterium]